MWLSYHHSLSLLFADKINALRPGVRGHAALFGDNMVGLVRRYPVVTQGCVVSPVVSHLGASWGYEFSCSFYLSLICFVRVFSYYFVLIRPCDYIYKAGRKHMSREQQSMIQPRDQSLFFCYVERTTKHDPATRPITFFLLY
jgi:hypothetical protein